LCQATTPIEALVEIQVRIDGVQADAVAESRAAARAPLALVRARL
jgi:hypothetical protein